MRLVNEVKMSPSVFSKGLVTAGDKGVLIGFEFEVGVPLDSQEGLNITSSKWTYLKSIQEFLSWIKASADSVSEDVEFEISEDYTKWAKQKTKEFLESLSEDGLDKLTSLYDEVYDKHSLVNMTKFVTLGASTELQARLADFLELSDYEETDDYLLFMDHVDEVTRSKLNSFVSDSYGNIAGLFKKFGLKYSPQEKDVDDRYHLIKNSVRDVTQAEIAKTQVHVIDIAKTITKNLTDWYIEPDTTIRPDDKFNYTGAEIVSPPLKPSEAMAALDAFYAASKKHGWVTNNSTGLHINVSIPAKIDVLKLTLFLGDKYVLKSFGREGSAMARSVLDDLEKGAALDNIVGLNPNNVKRLAQSAKYFADNHYASISYETNVDTLKKNKYISFRHAGGDYLNEMQKIKDTIGRFVTTMMIAADPNAYKEEYMKKLYKLASPKETENG